MNIGVRIKNLREDSGLTQEQLGKIVGVKKAAVQKWESGTTQNLKSTTIKKLAETFGVPPSYVLAIEDGSYAKGNETSYKILPVLGRIAAGEPVFAEENYECCMMVREDMDADFCIQAKGDSMVNARILDGDIIYIKRQPDVEDGEIAAVLIDDDATLKRVYKMPGRVQLRAENPTYKPIDITEKDGLRVNILGKAVAFQSQVR